MNNFSQIELQLLNYGVNASETIVVEFGVNLRVAMLNANKKLYPDGSEMLNCRGAGVCGKCAVEVFKGSGWVEVKACSTKIYKSLKVRCVDRK